MDRRTLLAAGAAAFTSTVARAGNTVPPYGETAVPTPSQHPLPLGVLETARYPDPHIEAIDKKRFKGSPGTGAVERVATGMRWCEGPAYFRGGRYLIFSDIPNNRQMRLLEDDGHLSVFRQPSMNSNGNTCDREGRLVTCEHSGRRVTRTEHDGTITIIADSYDGKKLNSPNDVVVASDGSIWFTDPSYGLISNYESIKAKQEQAKNNVYRVDPRSGAVKVVADDFVQPNGLAFSPDEKTLYIIDSGITQGGPGMDPQLRRRRRGRQAVERKSVRRHVQAGLHRRLPLRHRGQFVDQHGLGRPEAGRRPLLLAAGRDFGQDPPAGDLRQPHLRRPPAQPAVHVRARRCMRVT